MLVVKNGTRDVYEAYELKFEAVDGGRLLVNPSLFEIDQGLLQSAKSGDYIVRGWDGCVYVVSEDLFDANFSSYPLPISTSLLQSVILPTAQQPICYSSANTY